MPALASCYFCGNAVGASLDEYDLPEDAPADDQVTVTLCARCEGKLSELLDEMGTAATAATSAPVFEADSSTAAAGADGSTDATAPTSPAAADSTADPDLDAVAGEQEPIFADEDALLDDESVDSSEEGEGFVGDDAPFGETASEDAEADSTDDADSTDSDDVDSDDPIAAPPAADSAAGTDSTPGSEADTDPDGAADQVHNVEDSPDGDESTVGEGTVDEGTVEQGAQDGAAVNEAAVDDDADAGREAATAGAGTGGAGTPSRGASAESAATAGESVADGPLADVSPRTYNRVVRLLQNREFPVDRTDFETLAASAYELDHGECAAALDGAIEKGLLEERGGELHRPE